MVIYSRRQQTVNEYLAGPESLTRQGLIWGSVVREPAPTYTHQAIVTRIVVVLDDHVREHRTGLVCVSPLDVVLDEKRALIVQPDVVFISNERAAILRNQVWGAPDLVVEVESLSTRSHDRTAKRRWYRRYGVREYWLIDPIEAAVTVMGLAGPRSTRRRFHGEHRLRSAVLPDLQTPASAFFD
jgi:Uma2 family endonuclease